MVQYKKPLLHYLEKSHYYLLIRMLRGWLVEKTSLVEKKQVDLLGYGKKQYMLASSIGKKHA